MLKNARFAATVASLAVGFLAPKVVDQSWKMVTGHNPPEQDDKGRLLQVLLYSALSAVVVTAIERGVSMAMNKYVDDKESHIA